MECKCDVFDSEAGSLRDVFECALGEDVGTRAAVGIDGCAEESLCAEYSICVPSTISGGIVRG